ncbi:MAG: YdaS family helix-turn-helix protein [Rhodoferax sp.]|nr:YdaS family helix-turn-helix protein [Rhodoferax sp.]MDP3650922.1 YdaS family helix-turn-helix protein [Rhodoferax sp.]
MEITLKTPLERAVDIAGGMTKLARSLGLTGHATIYQWKKKQVPAEYCPDIEGLTGIQCEDLRPDVNWAVLRNHPYKALTETVAAPGLQVHPVDHDPAAFGRVAESQAAGQGA